MKVLSISMNKQLDTNTAFIQVRVDIDQCGRIVSKFVRKHFGSDEFSTISGEQDNKLSLGFGYKVDGYPREVGHILHKYGVKMCVVVINNFAKKRFIQHLNTTDIVFRILPKMMD